MIIGISGKIGSGKDSIAYIIKSLSAGATNGEIIEELKSGDLIDFYSSKWEVKKFAGKLKQIASLLIGVPMQNFESQEYKKTYLPKEWNYNPIGEDWVDGKPQEWQMTVREFLQKLGTEAIRDTIHENAWVNALFADYAPTEDYNDSSMMFASDTTYSYPNWVITDMRFPNEYQAVKERGGITIRVNREINVSTDIHPSEIALDSFEFDYIIENNGTIEELVEKVKIILEKEKIK